MQQINLYDKTIGLREPNRICKRLRSIAQTTKASETNSIQLCTSGYSEVPYI